MRKNFNRIFNSICIVFTVMIFLYANSSICQNKNLISNPGWKNVTYSLFFTNHDIKTLLADQEKFNETMKYFEPVKINKVYLEGINRGEEDVELLKKIAGRFHLLGIKTSGAMVPTSESGGPMCYNNPDDLASLERRTKALATVFDDIILDDWLFTICTCEKCFTGRGVLSWADYRTILILEKSKKHIIDVAKKINPKVKVIIKYPNWYECHRLNGYDVFKETNQFDQMAVGIETRIPETQDQHIPIYSGYIFQKWWASVDPAKWIGSWLDNFYMKGAANDYNAQVWQAVLAQAPEIILWCAGQLFSTGISSDVYPHFVEMLPEFDRVAGMIKGIERGVPIYLPYGSTGEYNIFGYLGQIGIPLTPVAKFPTEGNNAIFTLHSLRDPELTEKMISRLKNGKDIFLTSGLLEKLQDSEFKNAFSILPHGGTITTPQFRIREGWDSQISKSERSFTFPRIQTTTWPYVRDVAVVQEDYDYGVLLRTQYFNGTIYVLNLPDNYYDLFRFPENVLEVIRRAFQKEIEVSLCGPGNVSMYLFDKKQFVLYNMNDNPVTVSLRFTEKVPLTGWTEIVNNETVTVKEETIPAQWGRPEVTFTKVSLTLQPFKIRIIQAP